MNHTSFDVEVLAELDADIVFALCLMTNMPP